MCVKYRSLSGRIEYTTSGLSRRVILAGAADMFYEELKQIIGSVLQQGLSGQPLMGVLTANVNPAEIYASDDMLVTDS